MKTKKLSAVIILTMLLTLTFVSLYKILPAKANEGTANYIYRSDFAITSPSNFSFSEYVYVDNLNFTYDSEGDNFLVVTGVSDDVGSNGFEVRLFKNETGSFISVTSGGDYGETNCSLHTWHHIYYEFIKDGETISRTFEVDDTELFSYSGTAENYLFDWLQVGASSSDYTGGSYRVYFDDLNWTVATDDFESEFPADWGVIGNATLSTNQYYSATHSLVSSPTLSEAVNTISRSDFSVENADFNFSVYLYVDHFNTSYEGGGDNMRILRIGVGVPPDLKYVYAYLYKNSSGTYIYAEDNIGEYSWGGYEACSWASWHTIEYGYEYNGGNANEQFAVDGSVLFSESSMSGSYTFNFLGFGGFGAATSNYTLYFDDAIWTGGSDDFEGSFPGEWSTNGNVGLSTDQSVSPTHSLIMPSLPVSDTTAPTYSNVATNTTVAGQPCLFSTKWTDETGLATTGGFIFGTNNTGTWVNETWTAFTANPDWSNLTKTLNSTVGVRVEWQVWANDTSDNWGDTGIQYLITAPPDETPPTYSNISYNTTIAGQSCTLSVKWSDNVALSGFIFGTNNTGSWLNDTWTSLTENPSWANKTKTLNSTVGMVVGYRWYCNDTSNNWNDTDIQTLTTTAFPVILTILKPENITYSSGTIPVNLTASGGTIDKRWFNCKNETEWIYLENQTYTEPTSMTGFVNGTYTFYGWANNTQGSEDEQTVMFTVAISSEDETPTYSNIGTSTTVAGQSCLFSCYWQDNIELSGFIFSTNNTGQWLNNSWSSLSGSASWANVTKTLNSTVGLVIGYRWYCNDTSDNWNHTGILTFTTTSGEAPPYPPFTPTSTPTPTPTPAPPFSGIIYYFTERPLLTVLIATVAVAATVSVYLKRKKH